MGELTICNDYDTDATWIPNLFIDEYMKDANDAQIKIYLYLVRMMSAGRGTSISQIADQFNHTEKEVIRSLKYWEKKGLIELDLDDDGRLVRIHLCDMHPHASQADEGHVISIAPLSAAPVRTPARNTARRTTRSAAPAKETVPQAPGQEDPAPSDPANKQRAELYFVVEQYIGKPLGVSEMMKINYIADDLHFSDDLIDYLVQYCVGMGKKDFRYIEKVALNWAKDGITTTDKARESVARGPKSASNPRRQNRNSSNAFNKFSQNQYDFDDLEKKIVNN